MAQPLPFFTHTQGCGQQRAQGRRVAGSGRGPCWAGEDGWAPGAQGQAAKGSWMKESGGSFLGPRRPWRSSHQRRDSGLPVSYLRPLRRLLPCPLQIGGTRWGT